ncbi:hypothetical protein GEMRC1_004369 [Eukaryota sp. GEM-RC1]
MYTTHYTTVAISVTLLFVTLLFIRLFSLKWLLFKLASEKITPPSPSGASLVYHLDKFLLKKNLLSELSYETTSHQLCSQLNLSPQPHYLTALDYYLNLYSHFLSTRSLLTSLINTHFHTPLDHSSIPPTTVRLLKKVHCEWLRCPPVNVLESKHWQDLGFQGLNPVTDFRGCGLLPITIIDEGHEFPEFRALFDHSIKFDWPFALGVISCSKLIYFELIDCAKSSVRRRLLVNQEGLDGVVLTVIDLLSSFAAQWEKKPRTLLDWPEVFGGVVLKAKSGTI